MEDQNQEPFSLDMDEKLNVIEMLDNEQAKLDKEILEAQVILRSLIEPLPETSAFKTKYTYTDTSMLNYDHSSFDTQKKGIIPQKVLKKFASEFPNNLPSDNYLTEVEKHNDFIDRLQLLVGEQPKERDVLVHVFDTTDYVKKPKRGVAIKKSMSKLLPHERPRKKIAIKSVPKPLSMNPIDTSDVIQAIKNYHKEYLVRKFLMENPYTQTIEDNQEFTDFTHRASNVMPDAYTVLKNYYMYVKGVDLGVPTHFSTMISKLLELMDNERTKEDIFPEIPYSEFIGNTSISEINKVKHAIDTYARYWEHRLSMFPHTINRYKEASEVWKKQESYDNILDDLNYPNIGSTTSMEDMISVERNGDQVEIKPAPVNRYLAVVPSKIESVQLEPTTFADNEIVLKLSPLTKHNKTLERRIESRWAQILVNRAKKTDTFPGYELGSKDYNSWIREQMNRYPMSDILETLLMYYTEIKNVQLGGYDFAKIVEEDYETLYFETGTQSGSIPYIPARYFPKTELGDENWKKYLRKFKYLNDPTSDEKALIAQFEQNVQDLIEEVVTIRKLKQPQLDKNYIRESVKKTSILDLIKEKVRRNHHIPFKYLSREFIDSVQRNVEKILSGYDPSTIEPMTIQDFKGSVKQEMEEQEYERYILKRDKAIREYQERLKRQKIKPSTNYFKLTHITQ